MSVGGKAQSRQMQVKSGETRLHVALPLATG
jgi:hypothetical protein